MTEPSTSLPARGASAWAWLLIALAVTGAVVVVGASTFETQMFLAISAVIAVVGFLTIPRAALHHPIGKGFLGFALAAHVVGSLLRYVIIQSVYHGVADAQGYFGAGVHLAPQFRALQFPPFPEVGTPFMNWATGLLVAFIGPTMLGAFAVCAALGFVGSWYFYKAFRIAFPEGDHSLYAFLIFLLPSMWYWPSSLGKDALVVLFAGVATYGLASIVTGRFLRGFVPVVVGLFGTVMVRPPIAAALAVAAAAAYLIRPARTRSLHVQVLVWLLLVPALAGLAVVTIRSSQDYVKSDSPVEAFEAQQAHDFSSEGGSSNYVGANPFSPVGFPVAMVTVNLRPFPWEAGSALPAAAAMEGVVLALVLFHRRREILRALRGWHGNGMVILVLVAWVAISILLASLTNFGLLARQRTQALPFLFMLPCVIPRLSSGRWGRSATGEQERVPATMEPEAGPADALA